MKLTEARIEAARRDVRYLMAADNSTCPEAEEILLRLMAFVADAEELLADSEQQVLALEEIVSAFDEQPDQAAALSFAEQVVEKAGRQ